MRIKVSIPVIRGGYTGQRDQWEEFEREFQVGTNGDLVKLTADNHDTIQFSPEELMRALALRRDLNAQ